MRIHILRNILLTSIIAVVLIFAGCKKTATTTQTIPVVGTTNIIINLTSSTAQSGGLITNIGDDAITANGVCYSTTDQTPTTSDMVTTDSINTKTYTWTSHLTGLSPNTKYYLRAYATNSIGTGYGSVVTFTTTSSLSTLTAVVTTIAGNGTAGYVDGPAASAEFNSPQGIASDGQGNLYVADTYNNVIRKISSNGIVSTFAGNGSIGISDGQGTKAQFYGPQGLAVDGQGNVFVADAGNNEIRKITPSGLVTTFAGVDTAGFIDGTGYKAKFNSPHGLFFDSKGNLYVADRGNNLIRRITPDSLVTTISGTTAAGYVNAAAGAVASYYDVSGVAVDAAGNIYIADEGNTCIREISTTGVVTTLAGAPKQLTDVGYPTGITVDANANLYITDGFGRVLEITAGKALYTLAGNYNVFGFSDGTGVAAQFNSPQQIITDNKGNFYVADSNNNRIRMLVPTTTTPTNPVNSFKKLKK
jgi:sugar lactone lactonase YvrE